MALQFRKLCSQLPAFGPKNTVPAEPRAAHAIERIASDEPGRPKILAVDDQRDSLTIVEWILSTVRAEVVFATSGLEALKLLEDDDFALVLLDVSMPEMDGFEVAQRIRESERRRGCVPVILLTGADRDEQSIGKGYAAGAVDLLFKPVSPSLLRHKVQVFLTLFNERKAWEKANSRHLELQHDLTVGRVKAERATQELTLQKAELEDRFRELANREPPNVVPAQ
jgi:CheY-like chemotaxis protein